MSVIEKPEIIRRTSELWRLTEHGAQRTENRCGRTAEGANLWTIRNLIPRPEEQGYDDPWAGINETGQTITVDMRERLGMKNQW